MENKLKNLPALGPTLDSLKSQVEAQKVCSLQFSQSEL